MFPPLAPPSLRAPRPAIHSASRGQARAEPLARPPQSAMRSSMRCGILAYAISPCRSGLKPSGARSATRAARGDPRRCRRAMNDKPLFLLLTLRGGVGDHHKHHASNSLYLRPVLDAINMPYQIIDEPGDISAISRCYRHTRTFSRPMAVVFTRDLLRGGRS